MWLPEYFCLGGCCFSNSRGSWLLAILGQDLICLPVIKVGTALGILFNFSLVEIPIAKLKSDLPPISQLFKPES
ncbi:hypothetical protein PIB30_031249 [Stylosanthes scabra]|uniref:Uncharacterized protein n=1 Tax=Stylosanthes scabra TaxID=79078 RepID=A0ABU6WET2_9FABA|nr:hypothetical protein [Stylosanthes scabra]